MFLFMEIYTFMDFLDGKILCISYIIFWIKNMNA